MCKLIVCVGAPAVLSNSNPSNLLATSRPVKAVLFINSMWVTASVKHRPRGDENYGFMQRFDYANILPCLMCLYEIYEVAWVWIY